MYRHTDFLFLKLRKSTFQGNKGLWCPNEAFRIILLQRHNKFCGVIIQRHKKTVYLGKIFRTQFDCMTENYLENGVLNCSTA